MNLERGQPPEFEALHPWRGFRHCETVDAGACPGGQITITGDERVSHDLRAATLGGRPRLLGANDINRVRPQPVRQAGRTGFISSALVEVDRDEPETRPGLGLCGDHVRRVVPTYCQ